MARAKKIQIVNEAGTQAARVIAGVLINVPASNQKPTARAHKVIIVDPVTGSETDVVLGSVVTT